MGKNGSLLEIGAVVIVILATIGATLVIFESRNVYVGDITNLEFYNYKLCPDSVKKIHEENQLIFKNIDEAKGKGFKEVEGCV